MRQAKAAKTREFPGDFLRLSAIFWMLGFVGLIYLEWELLVQMYFIICDIAELLEPFRFNLWLLPRYVPHFGLLFFAYWCCVLFVFSNAAAMIYGMRILIGRTKVISILIILNSLLIFTLLGALGFMFIVCNSLDEIEFLAPSLTAFTCSFICWGIDRRPSWL